MQVIVELPDQLGKEFQTLQQNPSLYNTLTRHFSEIIKEQRAKKQSDETSQVDRILETLNNPDLDDPQFQDALETMVEEGRSGFREGFEFRSES